MQAGELSETFARRAAKRLKTAFFTNPASRFFFRYSEKVSGIGFTVMNIAMMNKSHLHTPGSLGDAGQHLMLGGSSMYTLRATARLKQPDGKLSDLRRTAAALVQFTFGGNAKNLPPGYQVIRWFDRT